MQATWWLAPAWPVIAAEAAPAEARIGLVPRPEKRTWESTPIPAQPRHGAGCNMKPIGPRLDATSYASGESIG